MGRRDARVLLLLCVMTAVVSADGGEPMPRQRIAASEDADEPLISRQDTAGLGLLTNGLENLNGALAGHGVEIAVGSTNIYQTNVKGGLDTHRRSGRFSGSYDLEIAVDLEKLLCARGLGLFIHGEGGWPDTEGIDEAMVGSFFGVNADAVGNRCLDVVEVFCEWQLLDGELTLQAGKMDLAGVFDTSAYATDETSQFLNGALVNNPTIPLPDYCLGLVLTVRPAAPWYVAATMADAEADGRTTGFGTAFHGPDYFFYAVETGIAVEIHGQQGVLPGNYRCGLWYDPQPKSHSDGDEWERDDVGLYCSLDQMVLRESADPEDGQGLGLFARYGWADERRNDTTDFWSFGMQYQGLLPGRDDDILALGFALGVFSDHASETFPGERESALELYYSVQAAPWAAICPSIQYIAQPGGADVADAIVVAVRAQVAF